MKTQLSILALAALSLSSSAFANCMAIQDLNFENPIAPQIDVPANEVQQPGATGARKDYQTTIDGQLIQLTFWGDANQVVWITTADGVSSSGNLNQPGNAVSLTFTYSSGFLDLNSHTLTVSCSMAASQ